MPRSREKYDGHKTFFIDSILSFKWILSLGLEDASCLFEIDLIKIWYM